VAADGADLDAKINAANIAADEKMAQSIALIAEKAKLVSDAARRLMKRLTPEYDAEYQDIRDALVGQQGCHKALNVLKRRLR
jgi:hypothetical protein